jgi:hypothetical protein
MGNLSVAQKSFNGSSLEYLCFVATPTDVSQARAAGRGLSPCVEHWPVPPSQRQNFPWQASTCLACLNDRDDLHNLPASGFLNNLS